MTEMRNFAEGELPEFESRSRSVSFPDHYLVPYIEMCKRSKPITCAWSLFLIGLAIFFFFATNYMLPYPVTEARKIACVFGGISSLVAAASCLECRFRILEECRGGSRDTVLFEIARRDTVISDSFSGHFDMHETSFCHGTLNEGSRHTETPKDTPSETQSIDDPCFARVSRVRHNGYARVPRHSISGGMTPDTPLLPQRRPLGLFGPSLMNNGIDSKTLRNGRTVSDNNKHHLNYSTFENGCEAPYVQPLLAKSTFENGSEATDTEPLLVISRFENVNEATDTEPLLANSTFENGSEASDVEPLLTKSTFENGCEASNTGYHLTKSKLKK